MNDIAETDDKICEDSCERDKKNITFVRNG